MTSNLLLHLINYANNEIISKQYVYHAPRMGEELRLGGEGNEKYYMVILVVWVYDEPECPFGRVNIGIEELKNEPTKTP